jgi:hypothetical protein
VQTFISSTRVARALTAAPAGHEEATLDALQAEVIDHYSVVQGAIDSRRQYLTEIEAIMMDIAEKRSADPVAAEMQLVCNGLERAVELYNDSMATLTNLANAENVLLDEATIVRNAARSIRVARKYEADEFSENLERQISQRMNAMQQNASALSNAADESRRRQVELQQEIERLERERQQRMARQGPPGQPQFDQLRGAVPQGYNYPGATPMPPPPPPAAPPSHPPPQGEYDAFFV